MHYLDMEMTLKALAYVKNDRNAILDDNWGEVVSEIVLDTETPSNSLIGLDTFSHVYIIYYFDKIQKEKASFQYRHPRNNTSFPKIGTFAQRIKNRPNQLGLCIAELLEVRERSILVGQLDAIDMTPVLDIKPVMSFFQAKNQIIEPSWVKSLGKNYW